VGGDRVEVRLDGTFDAAEAWRLHDLLAKVPPGSSVWLDFSQVRSFHDFAIALLAQDLAALRGFLETTGLCQHQRRILGYFGVDEGDLGEPCAADSAAAWGEASRQDVADYL
jgi:STAS domain